MANHYEVLGVPVTSTYEELKKKYHSLVREHHPDKVGDQDSSRFHLVDQAWKVLSDSESRRRYDAQLKAAESQSTHPVQEEVKLCDTTYDGVTKQYTKNCRCGGQYILCQTEVCQEELLLVDCDNCSLSIVIDCDGIAKNKVDHS